MRTTTQQLVAVLACSALLFVGFVGVFGDSIRTSTDEPVAVEIPDHVTELHDQGYTGNNVSIGVIDVTDVNGDNPTLNERLVESRTFGEESRLQWGEQDEHGTAAAILAGGVAPDAELYFASITDERSFEEAVQWLREEDVDIIVAPVSFYGKPEDGSSVVERAVTDAVDTGTVVVTPAGNVGQSHWQGRFLPDDAGYQSFGEESRNYLRGEKEELVLWASWTNPDAKFTLELYRENESEPIKRSRPYEGDAYPNERIVTEVDPDANLSFRLRGDAEAGTAVTVTSPTHRFAISQRTGSLVAPGTARGVLTVGAYDVETGIVEAFSAVGPTADNRAGVDVVAPNRFGMAGERETFVGTSAAAPYVSGVVALLLDVDPTLTPAEITELLWETADDSPPYDDRSRVGGGILQPAAALDELSDDEEEGGKNR